LSTIDAEAALENYLILPDGRLGYRTLPAWTYVPVGAHYELLQYITLSAAGNAPRALRMLSRMTADQDAYGMEGELLKKLSSLQPDLKINVVTPESVTTLENYWRALAATSLRSPLFLQLFHRNLTILGQYNETVVSQRDLIAEALWPVIGRILRF